MKKLLFAVLFCAIPSMIFAWTDTTGSTSTATGDYDPKDIINSTYDRGTGIVQVEVTSGTVNTVDDIKNVVATSDTITHTKLDALHLLISTATDGISINQDQTFTLISTATDNLSGHLDATHLLISTATDAIAVNQDSTYLLISTGTDSILTQLNKDYVLKSTGTDSLNNLLDKTYILESTGTDKAVEYQDKTYILISTGTEGLNQLLDMIYHHLSTNTVASDTMLTNIHNRLKDVSVSSGTVKKFQVQNSTGTTLKISDTAVSTYSPPAGVNEIWLQSSSSSTASIRYRFYNEQVLTAGKQLPEGQLIIIDTWKGNIYFQAESGLQEVIIESTYE